MNTKQVVAIVAGIALLACGIVALGMWRTSQLPDVQAEATTTTSSSTTSTTVAPTTTTEAPPTTTEAPATTTTTVYVEPELEDSAEVGVAQPEAVGWQRGDPISDEYWERMAHCETGGNWQHYPGAQYSGGLGMFTPGWIQFGGGKYAPTAGEATREQQIEIANVWATHGLGGWGCLETVGYP